MDAGKKIVVLGAVGVGCYLLYKLSQRTGIGGDTIAYAGGSNGAGGDFTITDDQVTKQYDGTFAALTNLPGIKQGLAVVGPAYYDVAKPIANAINNSSAVRKFNAAISSPVVTTVHTDGTIDRHIAKPNWYERNIGEPISSGATSFVKSLKFW